MPQTYTCPLRIDQKLQNLRLFISVADTGSITRAARQLFKAPSAITRSVIELEQSVGVPLFERKARGMLLNAYGEAALVRARRIHDEIQIAANELLSSKATHRSSSPAAIVKLLFNSHKLQLLIQLAVCRNISSAAAKMNITPASASMTLSQIEAGIGQSLFQRRVQGMAVTTAANRLIVRAKRVFSELHHMDSDISAIYGSHMDSVAIGTTALARSHFFPGAIAAAISQHPALRVTLVDGSYEQLIRSLRKGDVDMVFGAPGTTALNQGLTAEPLFTDRLGIVVRAGHPLAQRAQIQLSELFTERWILPSLGRRPLLDACFRKLGLPPPVASVETGDVAILREILHDSDMLAVTSPNQLMLEIRSGLLKELPVTLEGTTRQVGLVVRDGAMLSPAALTVLEAVRSQLPEHRGHQQVHRPLAQGHQ